jgi:ketosteroid isomerase-like protein
VDDDCKPPHSNSPDESDDPLPNSAADDFFVKMNHDFRRPKPSEEAVAAALHAIQTLAGEAAEHKVEATPADDFPEEDSATRIAGPGCPKCGAGTSGSNRFCGLCGTALVRRGMPATHPPADAPLREPTHRDKTFREPTTREQQPRADSVHEQHIHHHHHHYFPGGTGGPTGKPPAFEPPNATLTGELAVPKLTGTAAAEAAVQKLMVNWTLFCNSKRLDDLLSLYSPDAIVLRSNVAPAHGHPAIRELLKAALQAGLGDVELQPADAGVLGDIACLTGTSRMLVPTAPGKRHEETGKFLIVARRESGAWKILADSWCIDVFPKASSAPTPPTPIVRTPRK